MINTKKFVFDLEELEDAKFPLDELFSLEVNHNNVKYEFLIRFASKNKNLICFGSGAYNSKIENIQPPIYRRHSWQSEFEESVIYYNDPTLYIDPDLNIGWGVGKNDEWYLVIIADIIRILAGKNEIEPENILFFGSSGGGFTAVVLSTLIKDSSVMVNNPQIFLTNFWKEKFDQMIDSCFDNLSLETVLTHYSHRFDIVELFRLENYMPRITYIVNIYSVNADITNQLVPFITKLASFEEFNDQVNILLYRNEEGHNGQLDTGETIKLIKNHFKQDNGSLTRLNGVSSFSTRDDVIEKNTLKINSIGPLNNVMELYRNRKIELTFNEPIQAGNMWIELETSDKKIIPITKSVSDNVLTINHSTILEPGTKYNIILHTGCITDLAGNPLPLCNKSFITSKDGVLSKIPSKDAYEQ